MGALRRNLEAPFFFSAEISVQEPEGVGLTFSILTPLGSGAGGRVVVPFAARGIEFPVTQRAPLLQ